MYKKSNENMSKKCPIVEYLYTGGGGSFSSPKDFCPVFMKPYLDSMDAFTTYASRAIITFMDETNERSESGFNDSRRSSE